MGTRWNGDERGWLHALQPGDVVQRVIGTVTCTMRVRVTAVTATRVECGDWTFDRDTGWEIDDELGWSSSGSGAWIRPLFC